MLAIGPVVVIVLICALTEYFIAVNIIFKVLYITQMLLKSTVRTNGLMV